MIQPMPPGTPPMRATVEAVEPAVDTVTEPVGPVCAACGGEAVVHWLRRPTVDEVTEVVAVEEARRADLLLLADPALPAPDFGPLPTGDGMVRSVYACASHAVPLAAAARVHESTCTAPNPDDLPGCNCTPEIPVFEPLDDPAPPRGLPDSWITG